MPDVCSPVPATARVAGFFLTILAAASGASAAATATAGGVAGGSCAWIDCTFGPVPKLGEKDAQARLLLMTVGGRIERAVLPPLGMAAVDASGLKVDGGRMVGEIVIGHEPRRQNRSIPRLACRMPLRIELAIAGDRVSGTFAGSWPKPKSITQPLEVKGSITGFRRDEKALRAANDLAAVAAWPSWLGPNQNFSSGPAARPAIEDLNDARLVWASQYIGPPEGGSHRYGACVGTPPAAGGASPLVWKGRVYQFRYEPAGEVCQKHLDTILSGPRGDETRQKMKAVGWTMADMRRRWAILADEQLLCIDAATGRTLWTATWPGEGLLLFSHKCGLTNHTGAIADGRVFVFGTMGVVRCVDAETGKTRWRADVPGYSDYMKKLKAKALRDRHLAAPTRSFCHGLNVSGSVVVAPDGIGSCGLVGLDARTGRALWRVPKVLGKLATPMAWSKDGRHYVVAANENGTIACIDAADGKVAWRYDEAGANMSQTLLAGDLLLGHKLKGEAREKVKNLDDPGGVHSAPGSNYGQVACWRLTPEGIDLAWEAPADWGAPWFCPVGSASGELVCFRGKYSYYLVRAATGERVASRHLPTPVRWDEGHMLALPGLFVLNPDSQHGHTKMFPFPARPGAKVGPLWSPPHPHATTYQAPMSHAWADGRLFIRGSDAVYCYDLRK